MEVTVEVTMEMVEVTMEMVTVEMVEVTMEMVEVTVGGWWRLRVGGGGLCVCVCFTLNNEPHLSFFSFCNFRFCPSSVNLRFNLSLWIKMDCMVRIC